MLPPHQTPSADLLERIRRYIAAHLQGSSDIIEEAKRKLPHPVPRPFEGERERHGIARDPGVHEEPLVCGVTLPRPRKIRTDKNYHPKIRVVYAFIFVLRLNLDDARDLLASAGYSISPAHEYDLAMQYCIEEGFDIDTVNEILYALGMDVL